jgi:hypothetical protein
MVCPPKKASQDIQASVPNLRSFPGLMPQAAFAAFHRQRMEHFLAINRLPMNMPFPTPSAMPNSTIFPPLLQQQALFIRQYQQFLQQQHLNNFLQKFEEIRADKLRVSQRV